MNAAGQLIYRNPAGQLGQVPGTNFDWVNGQLSQESGGSIQRRYVYGPAADEALVWYEGSGTGDRRCLHADERGSVVAVSDNGGNAIAINSYDEYDIPGANNQGRFQYTGQAWLPELGMYDYKARMYSPTLGRFMQTDPIGYDDGLNWYNYAGGDPINNIDPSGNNCQSYTGTARGGCEAEEAKSKADWERANREFCRHNPSMCQVVRGSNPSNPGYSPPTQPPHQPEAPRYSGPGGSNPGTPQSVNDGSVLESRRGERGYAGSNKSTRDPNKHMKGCQENQASVN